nr:putative ribonuclease H-like domain-containing protein [Tanacetum cinerariifolium]
MFVGKRKKHSHKQKSEDTNQENFIYYSESINGKTYILVIVDDFSRFTWVQFLRLKDEAREFIIKFLKMIQVRLNASVMNIRTDNETEFVSQSLRIYYEDIGISRETSVARTSQQNGVVERQNRTLVEAACNMLIYAKAPLFLNDIDLLLDSSVALIAFADADHASCQDTRRSTSGSVQFLGERLYKLVIKKAKEYHFIKERVKNGVIELYFINTEYQLAYLFTKALGRDRIEFLINKLKMRSFTPETLKQLMDEVDE